LLDRQSRMAILRWRKLSKAFTKPYDTLAIPGNVRYAKTYL